MNLISIVIPAYNEGENVEAFYGQLSSVLNKLHDYNFEIVYVNDGSTDNTAELILELAKNHSEVKLIDLSRNFGKEIATTAGIHYANGNAIITIDADGQHPPEFITNFIARWEKGAQVVVGLRTSNQKEGFIKRYGSILFYRLFNASTGIRLIPGSTDFRLIDRCVQEDFTKMTERNRITRGLIDWLGYKREFIEFAAKERMGGQATYSVSKLIKLALDSFVSLSIAPLYFAIYVGFIIMPFALLLALFMAVEDLLLGGPLSLNPTGSAYLTVLVLFLVGLIIFSQGIMSLYLSHIHTETKNRPLFVVNKKHSNISLEKLDLD